MKPLRRSATLSGITQLKRYGVETAAQKTGLERKSHLNKNPKLLLPTAFENSLILVDKKRMLTLSIFLESS